MSNDISTQPMSFKDIQQAAIMVVKSGLFPAVKSEAAAMTLMMLCQAEDLHPIKALQRYDIIQGRVAMKTDAMLGEFQKRGGKVKWINHSDIECSAEFFSPGVIDSLVITWTFDQAKKAGLTGKDVWGKYPRQMLKARVISEGIRMTMPEIIAGIYTPEEVQDFDTQKSPPKEKIVNSQPVAKQDKELEESEEASYFIEVTEEMKSRVIEEIIESKTEEDLKSAASVISDWPEEVKKSIRPEYAKKMKIIKEHSDFL